VNKTLIAEMREWLETERDRLTAEVEEIESEGREALSDASGENNYRDHMADQGTATFNRELDMTLEENAREALKAVDAALKRMEEGTYGRCQSCEAVIDVERVRAIPTAMLCITCKAQEESR
jgi:DnaK suppressor protein